jgi:hypothetical protein
LSTRHASIASSMAGHLAKEGVANFCHMLDLEAMQ